MRQSGLGAQTTHSSERDHCTQRKRWVQPHQCPRRPPRGHATKRARKHHCTTGLHFRWHIPQQLELEVPLLKVTFFHPPLRWLSGDQKTRLTMENGSSRGFAVVIVEHSAEFIAAA